jgi:enamine deaminase RidA (YjgF/YER057c/UK114 family)
VEGTVTDQGEPRRIEPVHHLVNPEGMVQPRGFSHAVVAEPGRTIHVAGQVAADPAGEIVGDSLADQFDMALGNVAAVLAACDAGPEHVVSLVIFTTAMEEYRATQAEIGAAYRRHFGRYFPAAALLGVAELVPPAAKVEIVATAVVPTRGMSSP